jgi:uracil DNA glycosylase
VEETWAEALDGELTKPYALELCRFVTHERLHGPLPIYPPPHLVFHALNATPFDRVKAVIIGQVPPAPPQPYYTQEQNPCLLSCKLPSYRIMLILYCIAAGT